jgi:uncharacterized Fe-S center protein
MQAACRIVALDLVWVDHRKQLGEALADAANAVLGVSEGHLIPGHELHLSSG